MKLDRYDKAILQALQLDGRIANTALAERVNLSESACLRRVRALRPRAGGALLLWTACPRRFGLGAYV